jgi:hypothetical protein
LKTWLVDIDGTLAIRGERGPYDWHRVGEDKPNEPVIEVVRALSARSNIVFVSGRMEQCRLQTLDWLHEHVCQRVLTCFHSPLFMRADDDYRHDTLVKREIYEKFILGEYDVAGVIDDRAQVVRMWRQELGLTCLQVAEGNF